jgi:hypothetical protein
MVLFHNVMLDLLIRGFAFGFVGGLILILLFLLTQQAAAHLVSVEPRSFLYFVAGVLVGFSLIGGLTFGGLHQFADWNREKTRQFIKDSGNPMP